MKRRMVIILIAIIMILVFFLPSKTRDYDGGTTHYTALLYQVSCLHQQRVGKRGEPPYLIEGTTVTILGIEVYNSTHELVQ